MTRADLVQPSLHPQIEEKAGPKRRYCSIMPLRRPFRWRLLDPTIRKYPDRRDVMYRTAERSYSGTQHHAGRANNPARSDAGPARTCPGTTPRLKEKTSGHIQAGVKPAQATLPGTTPTRTPSGRSDGCPASTWTTDTPASGRRESRPKRRDFWTYNIGAASPQSFPMKPMRQRRGRSRTEQNRPYAVVTRVHGGGPGAPTAHTTIWIHGP